VVSSAFASANVESNQPKDQENDCRNPEQVHCESCSEENQDEQQCENQQHFEPFS
jgi:hypothetical protein